MDNTTAIITVISIIFVNVVLGATLLYLLHVLNKQLLGSDKMTTEELIWTAIVITLIGGLFNMTALIYLGLFYILYILFIKK